MENNYKKMKDHLYNGEVAYKIGYGNDYNQYGYDQYGGDQYGNDYSSGDQSASYAVDDGYDYYGSYYDNDGSDGYEVHYTIDHTDAAADAGEPTYDWIL